MALTAFSLSVYEYGTGKPVVNALAIHSQRQARYTNQDGYVLFEAEANSDLSFSVHHPDYKDYFGGVVHVFTNTPFSVYMQPKVLALPRIRAVDTHFVTERGDLWLWRGFSDFCLYKRYLDGEDIRPLLVERKAFGANILRVFGMLHNIARFYPREYVGYWMRLPEFGRLLSEYGLYFEYVMFADTGTIMPDSGEQLRHFDAGVDVLRTIPNAVLELLNENGHATQRIDPMRFQKPAGILCSRGSCLGDNFLNTLPRPGWDFYGWHGRRDWPKVTSSMEDAWYISNCQKDGWGSDNPAFFPPRPIVHDEPCRFGEYGIEGKQYTSPELAAQIALTSRILGAGGTFHSEAGVLSQPLLPIQATCARAFVRGLQ